jgi:hypothetical protein
LIFDFCVFSNNFRSWRLVAVPHLGGGSASSRVHEVAAVGSGQGAGRRAVAESGQGGRAAR